MSSKLAPLSDLPPGRRHGASEADEQYPLLLQGAGVGTWSTDLATGLTDSSPLNNSLFGLPPDAPPMDAAGWFALIEEEDRPAVQRAWDDARAAGRPYALEYRIRWPDGTQRWIESRGRFVRDAAGTPVRVVGISMDITDRKSAEEALRNAYALIEGITRGTDDLIAAQDRDFRYIYFNAAYREEFRRLWGRDLEAGTSMVEALAPWPEQQRKACELWRRALEGDSFRVTAEFGPSTEARQVYELRFSPVHDAKGGQIGAAHILRNVTEQVQMQQAVRRSEALVRRVLDNLFAFVGILTPDGTLIEANRAPLEAAGIDASDVIGRKFWDCYWWSYSAEVQDELRRAVQRARNGELVRYDVPVRMAGDTRMWIDFQIAPLRDDAGRITHLIPSAMDLTARREAEAALREADRRKDEFLATLAHELRNPLAPLRNGLVLLDRATDKGGMHARIGDMLMRQVNQLVRLIDDLLDVSRITQGKVELRRSRLDLASAILHAVEIARPLLEDHPFDLSLPADPLYVDGDPARLAQVFSNLLNNACKFNVPGGRIRLTAERRGAEVQVAVSDEGVGIPPEKLDDVFEMFTQLETVPERARGGLGIGLSLVRQLVRLHGGDASAKSEGEGRGATFVVRLPASADIPIQLPATIRAAGVRRRVLVVDDNVDAAQSLSLLLEQAGSRTQVACDGAEALEKVRVFAPDVVLLDIGLPDTSGYEVCRQLRLAHGRALTIVAVTGWGQEEDRQTAAEAGFDAHLVKPVDPDALLALLAARVEKTAP